VITGLPGALSECVAENHVQPPAPGRKRCGHGHRLHHVLYLTRRACVEGFANARGLAVKGLESFSLPPKAGTG
jgi:hypothetical protein